MTLPAPEPTLPESPYFSLERLAEGVYAALSRHRAAASNAAIVDLGGAALIFDTFLTPAAAQDLLAAATALTGSPVRYAVNSHWHADHVLGNSVLPDGTLVIATDRTRDLIAEHLPADIRQMHERRLAWEHDLHEAQNRFNAISDSAARAVLGAQNQAQRRMLESLTLLSPRLPDCTFARHLTVHGETRAAELMTFGGGHTASDAILHLPQEGIAFIADLLFHGVHAWMGDGDLAEWRRILLEDVAALDAGVIVPGHGPLATPVALAPFAEYLAATEATVADWATRLPTPPDLAAIDVPAAYAGLENADRFQRSVLALCQRRAAHRFPH